MIAEAGQLERLLAHLEAHSPERARDIKGIGVAATTISRAVDAGTIQRIGRGLYRLPDSPPNANAALVEVAKRAPKAVVCLTSALAFHELTDILPRRVWIAIGGKDWSPRIEYPRIRVVRFREPHLSEGVETHTVGGAELRVHSIAKTVADAFRLPKLVDRSTAVGALKTALDERKATPDAIGEWRCGNLKTALDERKATP